MAPVAPITQTYPIVSAPVEAPKAIEGTRIEMAAPAQTIVYYYGQAN